MAADHEELAEGEGRSLTAQEVNALRAWARGTRRSYLSVHATRADALTAMVDDAGKLFAFEDVPRMEYKEVIKELVYSLE